MRPTRYSFGIATRLTLGFLAVLVLLVALAGYSTTQISKLGKTFDTFNERTVSALGSSDLLTSMTALQMDIAQLSALNTQANKDAVASSYKQFTDSLGKQAKATGNSTLEGSLIGIREIVTGPTSLPLIQDQVDVARGTVAVATTMMTDTVAAMLLNIERFTDVRALSTIQDRVLRARMLIRSYQFTGSADEIGDALAALRDAERKFDQFDRMGPSVAQDPLVLEGRRNLETLFSGLGKIREAVTLREATSARSKELGAQVTAAIAGIRSDTLATMTQAGAAAQDTVGSSFRNSMMAAGFAVVLGLFLAYIIGRGISQPIKKMTAAMRHLSEGDLTIQIPGVGRSDEIGEMAGAMQVFKESAIERQRIAFETEANRDAAEREKRKIETEAAEQAIAGEREFVVAKFGSGLQGLAGGDLSVQLREEMPGQYERLRHDFNEAIGTLAETLRSVAQAASSIDGKSREINQSSDDLSRRTEQQAASLEETAAALDEITVNVANASKRADEARSVAMQANVSATESGRVVANAVAAMGRIEQASNHISNIIGVIDEIAFQTNLLALNAGVEAARAGDAGKGFAVVAQEVRELAQRSATAAKEIKDLIRNSSTEVQSGVKLVSETGDALKTIGEYIVSVNNHMNSIATSAKEQAVGLAEINTAINQMDQVTQQNAAMVEETNAAGASLVDEAAGLQELISRFTFDTAGLRHGNLQRFHTAGATEPHNAPLPSPARRMMAKVASAINGRTATQTAWQDF